MRARRGARIVSVAAAVVATVSLFASQAAAAPAVGPGDWLQAGHDARNSAFNHVEDQLGVDRVGRTEVVRTVRDLSAWAVVDGVLYGERDGRVTAVRSQDRTVLWQAPPPFECADVTQTLVVARVVIATITYACSETGMDSFEGVYGFDRSTGRLLWRGPGDAAISSIVAHEGRLFVSSYDGWVPDSLTAVDASTGAALWRVDGRFGQVASDGELVVVGSDQGVVAYDADDGSVRWSRQLGGYGYGAPILGTTLTYITSVSDSGAYLLHALVTATGATRFRLAREERPLALARGTLITRAESGGLVARDADSGRVQWRRALDVDRVVVADGVVWAGEDRRIHAIGLSTGRLLVTVWLASRLGYTQVMGVARGTVYAQSFHLDRLSPVVKVLRPA